MRPVSDDIPVLLPSFWGGGAIYVLRCTRYSLAIHLIETANGWGGACAYAPQARGLTC